MGLVLMMWRQNFSGYLISVPFGTFDFMYMSIFEIFNDQSREGGAAYC